MKSLGSLQPNSKTFLDIQTLTPLLNHYLIDSEGLEAEVLTFRSFLLNNNPFTGPHEEADLHDLFKVLSPLESAFPILTKSTQTALTLGTSTATVERSFSSLRRIHTYLRSTMTQGRLDDLAILSIERDLSSLL